MAIIEVPQTLEYRGGQLNAAPVLEEENFTNWKKRFMCHIIGIEPQFENIISNGTQRFSNAKATDQTECHKCGKKGQFARDCWSKTSVPSYQSPFQSKLLLSSENKPEPRQIKDFEAKYHKIKAKLTLLSSSALAPSSSSGKDKGVIAETYDWDDEEV
ncbi:retrovirus-related pol polyprotein from transposon TNT 1-94 [Tanacetum coccineum]